MCLIWFYCQSVKLTDLYPTVFHLLLTWLCWKTTFLPPSLQLQRCNSCAYNSSRSGCGALPFKGKPKQGSQHKAHGTSQGKQLRHYPRHTCSCPFDTNFHYPAEVWEPLPSLPVPGLSKASLVASFVDCAQFGETWTKFNLLKLPFLLFSLFFSCETALIDSRWAD